MAETSKRITGNYSIVTDDGTSGNVLIDTDTVTVNGNLNVVGTQTTVSSTDTAITDNTIILNDGETTNGISSGTAGIQIDRGISADGSTANDSATFTFNETDDVFETKLGSAFSILRSATPGGTPNDNDVVTVDYLAALGIGGSVKKIFEGDSKAEIYDSGATQKFTIDIDAVEVLEVTSTTLSFANVSVNGNSITNTATDENLFLSTTGTGELELNSVVTMAEQASDPSAVASKTKVYAKTPGGGGSGLYTTTQNGSDELVSKRKAMIFGLIF